jgi:hypothetical protein
MIILSAGLRKSGSGLYFNLTNDLLIAARQEDVRDIRQQYKLDNVLKYHNCNLEELTWPNLKKILPLHFKGKTFVVKTHEGPTKMIRFLMAMKLVKVTFIYRDPRDVLLSTLDHGEKIRRRGESHTFARFSSFENTIPRLKIWLDVALQWLELGNILPVKYEDLIEKPVLELQRLAKFLGIDINQIDLSSIYLNYRAKKLDDFQKNYLHFNVGRARRFTEIMGKEDLSICNRHFTQYYKRMGYNPE